jgi:hypothetical protein
MELGFPSGIQNIPYAVYENNVMTLLAKNSEIGFISQEIMTKIGVKLDKNEGLGDSNWKLHDMSPLLVNKAVPKHPLSIGTVCTVFFLIF